MGLIQSLIVAELMMTFSSSQPFKVRSSSPPKICETLSVSHRRWMLAISRRKHKLQFPQVAARVHELFCSNTLEHQIEEEMQTTDELLVQTDDLLKDLADIQELLGGDEFCDSDVYRSTPPRIVSRAPKRTRLPPRIAFSTVCAAKQACEGRKK